MIYGFENIPVMFDHTPHILIFQVKGFGFDLTMPNIVLNVLIDGVDVASVIDIDISDFTGLKPKVRSVELSDIGHIDVSRIF